MTRLRHLFLSSLLSSLFHFSRAIDLDIGDDSSIKSAASTIARNIMSQYKGSEPGQIPGILPRPYYWWQAGALWGELIEYWAATGDEQYNKLITEALLFQTGPERNFMPANVTKEEGNDDQAFWAFAALSAAELKFPDPLSQESQWIALAQAVFNTQVKRWDTETCGGGLRWQIMFGNPGWEYKNTISNGGFFQLAARLARYTDNSTYADWADKLWDWISGTPNLTPEFEVNDGSNVNLNCTDANGIQWSYNYGTFIAGAATMYSITEGGEQEKWRTRTQGLLDQLFKKFFPAELGEGKPWNENIMVEISCEPRDKNNCNNDQTSFKAYTSRWLAFTTQLAPFTKDFIMPKLRSSAEGAGKQCSGGNSGDWCGRNWNSEVWDGYQGIGEQMSALAVIQATLIDSTQKPLTAKTGATSLGDPNAGLGSGGMPEYVMVTKSEKVGAVILSILTVIGTIGTAWWMIIE